MLDRMPVADEDTVRNRRARFRNDDVSNWEAFFFFGGVGGGVFNFGFGEKYIALLVFSE